MKHKHDLVLAAIAVAVIIAVSAGQSILASAAHAQTDSPPDGVQMLLPRGGIPAVFEPEFVAAGDADIDDDAWVLGIVINGEAHAYSLNLLNAHEIVNDEIGDLPVAAVW